MASIGYVKYLGGLPGEKPSKVGGNLQLTDECIGIGTLKPKSAVIRWSDMAGVSFRVETVQKSRAGKVVLFGPLGLLAKNTKNQTALMVQLKDGNAALYEVDKMGAIQVRGKFQPFLSQHRIPCLDDSPGAGASPPPDGGPGLSIADELAKLAELKNQGVLSEEEFAAQKARLLSQ